MYLWKCWRDTRIKFLTFLVLFLCLELTFIFGHKVSSPASLGATELRIAFSVILMVVGSVLLFLGWILGNESVGADIGHGYGDYLLTRPQSRGSFVWTAWTFSMVETIVLWIVFCAIAVADVFSLLGALGVSSSVFRSALFQFARHDMPLMFLIFLINLGLIFGVTYCIGVILRSSTRALIGSAALIFAYQILKVVLRFEYHINLPDILLSYPNPHNGMAMPAIHEFVVRGIVALAFPLLAHFALERMEI